jgi:hypothetical protein
MFAIQIWNVSKFVFTIKNWETTIIQIVWVFTYVCVLPQIIGDHNGN